MYVFVQDDTTTSEPAHPRPILYYYITCRVSRLLWWRQRENFKLQFSNLRTNKRVRSQITFSYIHFLAQTNNS